jgi:hypothetical protein
MRDISAGEAKVGDIVAEPLVNSQGRVLLPKGANLSAAVLSRLQGWGVHELKIEGDAAAAIDENSGSTLEEELEIRFSDWADDQIMVQIKHIALGHQRRRGQVSRS